MGNGMNIEPMTRVEQLGIVMRRLDELTKLIDKTQSQLNSEIEDRRPPLRYKLRQLEDLKTLNEKVKISLLH
jgi:flagellar biosynthesis chaperone FliJ